MLLDEVDLLLHPLKSELNFPCGEKFDLDAAESGERWGLPIHLMDALFFAETGKVSVYEQQGSALVILNKLSVAIKEGFAAKALQRLPHVTLLDKDFYHGRMKPILAEWSYLWLQMQHLHGISRDEAVQYVLEGAAAKSDSMTKMHLIEQEKERMQVKLGLISAEPALTDGLKDSAPAFSKAIEENSSKLMRQCSNSSQSSGQEDLYKMQLAELELALAASIEHSTLINAIYKLDTQFEATLRTTATELAQVKLQITEKCAQIERLETPHDASLDNSVIVWYSKAFGHAIGSNTSVISKIHAVCKTLEELGMTVVRCSNVDEIRERTHPLQVSGRLRCVVVGGGEIMDSCGHSCEETHNGNCVVCGKGMRQHRGHDCADGKRGSWALGDTGFDFEALDALKEMLDPNTDFAKQYSVLPTSRAMVFAGESKLTGEQRLTIWDIKTQMMQDDQVRECYLLLCLSLQLVSGNREGYHWNPRLGRRSRISRDGKQEACSSHQEQE